jgi:hypothetical protein
LFDWPAAFLEGKAGIRRARDRAKEAIIDAEARASVRQIDREREENIMFVGAETLEQIKRLPPPAEDSRSAGGEAEPPTLDDDWMNRFIRYAEDASSERMRQLWGRVLAGEIIHPGTFSMPALRFLAELDQGTAVTCENIAPFILGDFIIKGFEFGSGELLTLCLYLEEVGLFSGVQGRMEKNFLAGPDGSVLVKGKRYGLICRNCAPGTPAIVVPAILLTRVGREVFELLPARSEIEELRKLDKYVIKAEGMTVDIVQHAPAGGDLVTIKEVERLWPQ